MIKIESLILILIACLLNSCAAGYRNIAPEIIKTYVPAPLEYEGIEFYYRYDVLKGRGNKRYAKKETRKAIHVVAIKLINRTNEKLTFGEDFNFYQNSNQIDLLSDSKVFKKLNQKPGFYLFYLVLTPFNTLTINNDPVLQSPLIGLLTGPPITAFNVTRAAGANRKFKTELTEYSLVNKTVAPQDTLYGILGIQGDWSDSKSLSIKIENK